MPAKNEKPLAEYLRASIQKLLKDKASLEEALTKVQLTLDDYRKALAALEHPKTGAELKEEVERRAIRQLAGLDETAVPQLMEELRKNVKTVATWLHEKVASEETDSSSTVEVIPEQKAEEPEPPVKPSLSELAYAPEPAPELAPVISRSQAVLNLLSANPTMCYDSMRKHIGGSQNSCYKLVQKLKRSGHLEVVNDHFNVLKAKI